MKNKVTAYVLLIVMSISFAAGAFAAPGDQMLFKEKENATVYWEKGIGFALFDKDTLYMTYEGNALYKYVLGEEGPTLLEDFAKTETIEDNTFLFMWEDTLYYCNPQSEDAYEVNKNTGAVNRGKKLNLPISLLDENGNETGIASQGVFGDRLFILEISYQKLQAETRLYSIDLNTGEKTAYKSKNINKLMSYKNGQIAAFVYVSPDWMKDAQAKPEANLSVFNPETDTLTLLTTFEDTNAAALAYNENEDAFYFAKEKKVYRMGSDFKPEHVAYVTSQHIALEDMAWITDEKIYILWKSWPGLIEIKNVDAQYKPSRELVITGYAQPDVIAAYIEKYPDIPVVENQENTYSSAEALVQAMLSGSLNADVIMIDLMDIPIQKIMEKEYALPLSSSQLIKETFAKMYPYLQEAFAYNGEIYFVPEYIVTLAPAYYYPDAWERIGLSEDEVPKTYFELIDLARRWQHELYEENENYRFHGDYFTKEFLINLVTIAYIDSYQKKGETVNFDTPLYRNLMLKIEEAELRTHDDVTEEEVNRTEVTTADAEYFKLFSFWGDNSGTPLYLTLDEGMGEVGYGIQQGSVAFVNPLSEMKEEAVAYLEEMINIYDDYRKLTLFPDMKPVEKGPSDEYNYALESLKVLKDQFEKASSSDKAVIQERIDVLTKAIEKEEENPWKISPEDIEKQQKIAEVLYVPKVLLMAYVEAEEENTGSIRPLLDHYAEGAITLDEFISQANKRVQMMALEDQ